MGTGTSLYFELVADYKRKLVEGALAKHDGNQTRAARDIGVSRSSMQRIVKELGIEAPRRRGRPSSNNLPALTSAQVDEIRRRYEFRRVTARMLAKEYGVALSAVKSVLRYRRRA